MKFLYSVCAFIVLFSGLTFTALYAERAPSLPTEVIFPGEFTSAVELLEWAQTSTIGGGNVETVDFHGANISVVYRMHTSGIVTSDIAVYTHTQLGKRILRASHNPVFDSVVLERSEHFLTFNAQKSNEVLLELTLADLMGAPCDSAADCGTSELCLKNETFVYKGLCIPCNVEENEYCEK